MTRLITLDKYFNIVGKELFSDWSEEAVYYYSERKKELKHLRAQALETYKVATNKIWRDGKVKVSLRLEQGYIDPPFAINEFYFAQSGCTSSDGGFYNCKLEINEKSRGRPKQYSREEIDDVIREYVRIYHITKNISVREIKHAAVINYVLDYLKKNSDGKMPSNNTIGNRLKNLYPEARKSIKDSNK